MYVLVWKYMNIAKYWSLIRWIQPTNLYFSGSQLYNEEEIRRMKERKEVALVFYLELFHSSFNFASKPLLHIYGLLQFILPVSFRTDFLKLCLWFCEITSLILWNYVSDFVKLRLWFCEITSLILWNGVSDFVKLHLWFCEIMSLILWNHISTFVKLYLWFCEIMIET